MEFKTTYDESCTDESACVTETGEGGREGGGMKRRGERECCVKPYASRDEDSGKRFPRRQSRGAM